MSVSSFLTPNRLDSDGQDYHDASYGDPNAYQQALPVTTRPPEPLAYLNMQLEVAKVSQTFAEALGRHESEFAGRRLVDILVPDEREKIRLVHRDMQQEKANSEQAYLPRILPKDEEDKVMQTLGFGPDALSGISLNRQEHLAFQLHPDEPARTVAVRVGLGQKDPVWFIVLALSGGPAPYRSPDTQARAPSNMYYPSQAPAPSAPRPQTSFSQRAPAQPNFEPRSIFSDGGMGRQSGFPAQMPSIGSPGFSSGASSYSPSPNRPDHPAGTPSYQIPRSELMPAPSRMLSHALMVQLPSIRSQPQILQGPPSSSSDTGWARQERDDRGNLRGAG